MSSLHIVFDNPVIPTNTGNAIRTAAVTGASLHLIEPLGFNFEDKHLKRAGLDYHDLADLTIHKDFDACMDSLPGARVFAFTTHTDKWFTTGLPEEHAFHPRVTERVRIPMMPARRSMNLSNAASTAVYEAWRQLGFRGAV